MKAPSAAGVERAVHDLLHAEHPPPRPRSSLDTSAADGAGCAACSTSSTNVATTVSIGIDEDGSRMPARPHDSERRVAAMAALLSQPSCDTLPASPVGSSAPADADPLPAPPMRVQIEDLHFRMPTAAALARHRSAPVLRKAASTPSLHNDSWRAPVREPAAGYRAIGYYCPPRVRTAPSPHADAPSSQAHLHSSSPALRPGTAPARTGTIVARRSAPQLSSSSAPTPTRAAPPPPSTAAHVNVQRRCKFGSRAWLIERSKQVGARSSITRLTAPRLTTTCFTHTHLASFSKSILKADLIGRQSSDPSPYSLTTSRLRDRLSRAQRYPGWPRPQFRVDSVHGSWVLDYPNLSHSSALVTGIVLRTCCSSPQLFSSSGRVLHPMAGVAVVASTTGKGADPYLDAENQIKRHMATAAAAGTPIAPELQSEMATSNTAMMMRSEGASQGASHPTTPQHQINSATPSQSATPSKTATPHRPPPSLDPNSSSSSRQKSVTALAGQLSSGYGHQETPAPTAGHRQPPSGFRPPPPSPGHVLSPSQELGITTRVAAGVEQQPLLTETSAPAPKEALWRARMLETASVRTMLERERAQLKAAIANEPQPGATRVPTSVPSLALVVEIKCRGTPGEHHLAKGVSLKHDAAKYYRVFKRVKEVGAQHMDMQMHMCVAWSIACSRW